MPVCNQEHSPSIFTLQSLKPSTQQELLLHSFIPLLPIVFSNSTILSFHSNSYELFSTSSSYITSSSPKQDIQSIYTFKQSQIHSIPLEITQHWRMKWQSMMSFHSIWHRGRVIHCQLGVTMGSSIQCSSLVHVTTILFEQTHFILVNTHPTAMIIIPLTSIQKQCIYHPQINITQSKLLESCFC